MRDSRVRKIHARLDCSVSIVAAKVTVFFYEVRDTVSEPRISPQKHAKKCVFGVFLNPTLIALFREN